MRFTSQLQHLNASTTSSQKAAHYALKNREMDEDFTLLHPRAARTKLDEQPS